MEARILLSGLPKGEYYRRCILGQRIEVTGSGYLSAKLAVTLEKMYQDLKSSGFQSKSSDELLSVLSALLTEIREEKNG